MKAQQTTRSIMFLGLSLAISFATIQGQTYSLSGLGFAGTINGVHQPLGISNSGQVVGFDDSKNQAFLWSAGVVSQLCVLLQNPSQASAISHNGLYVATGSPNQGVLIQWNQPRRDCDWMAFGDQNYASTGVNDVPDIGDGGSATAVSCLFWNF
jgi:probable HAF family extracellular repeat protein